MHENEIILAGRHIELSHDEAIALIAALNIADPEFVAYETTPAAGEALAGLVARVNLAMNG